MSASKRSPRASLKVGRGPSSDAISYARGAKKLPCATESLVVATAWNACYGTMLPW